MTPQERFKKLLAGNYTTFASLDKELQIEMRTLGYERMRYNTGSEYFSGIRLAGKGFVWWNRDLKIAMRKLDNE